MKLQFDLLVAIYKDGRLVTNNARQSYLISPMFQIGQAVNEPYKKRVDLILRSCVDTTHTYTRYNLADSNNPDNFYANNPQEEGLMMINMYANAQDVHRFYQVNIGPRERPLIVLQLFFSKNASIKEKIMTHILF